MWHRFLVNKLKNERRTNDHNVEAVAKKREYLKSLKDRRGNKEKKQKIGVGWGCPNFLPPNQPEDDEKAVKQLKAQLKAQARKKKEKQDDHIIKSRMEHTFADRRNQVVRGVSVCELKAEYSILFCAKEVSYNQNHQSVLVNSSHTHRVKVNFIISPSRMLTRKFHII